MENNEEQELPDAPNQESDEDMSDDSADDSTDEDNAMSGEDEPDTADYKALYEKEKQAKEKERQMRQGMVKKLQALTSPKKSQPKAIQPVQPVNQDTERLDKLELRQLDPNLTADQIKEVLLIKKTRGLSDAVEAYNNPMFQSWLKDERAKAEQKEKIEKAIPKTQSGGSASKPARETVNQSGRGSNLQDVAAILEREILGS